MSQKQLYFYSNSPDLGIPNDISVTQYLFKSFEKLPNRNILVDPTQQREYSATELKSYIERFAKSLSTIGIKKGDVVGVILGNIPEYLIVFHGILLIGAIASTLSPDYQMDEIKKTLGTTSPKLVITSSNIYPKFSTIQSVIPSIKNVISIGSPIQNTLSFASLLINDGNYPKIEINGKVDVAVLPFSSGTTGLPKGVELTHSNLIANAMQVHSMEFQFYSRQDTVMSVLPMFHIYGMVFFLIVCPSVGLKYIALPRFNIEDFLLYIQNYKTTITFIAPPIAVLLAKHPSVAKYNLDSLRMMFSGAAPLSGSIENAIKERFNGRVTIKQGYGLTEASPVIFLTPFNLIKSGSVGVLLPNQVVKIVDTNDNYKLLTTGEIGEICVKGPNVMKGYFNNPKATRETVDADGFLHTGDIGYLDEDGYCFISDRLKELIKYKGFQVPPAELEGLLLQHPAVADCAVIGIPDESCGELPRAYVVVRPNVQISPSEISQWLESQVAHYKRLRGGIIFIESIPKSAAGKILRKELKSKFLDSKL